MSDLSLTEALGKVQQVFNVNRVLRDFDRDITVPYYTQSEYGYSKFHSQQDCVHLALNEDGIFSEEGYYGQPRAVSEQIEAIGAQRVLELGSGKGFNSSFLAQRHPQVQFQGVDLTPLHVSIANKKAQSLPNLSFQVGDFNQLPFPDQSFDLIFGVDCLCHAQDAKIALAEIRRVLKPGGRLVVFDGYREPGFEQRPDEEKITTQLVEVSMAVVNGFDPLESWLAAADTVGLSLVKQQDLSFAIMPNLIKLQQLSQRYFRLIWRAKLIKWFLPKYLVGNSIAGLLMPYAFAVDSGPLGYYLLVFERAH